MKYIFFKNEVLLFLLGNQIFMNFNSGEKEYFIEKKVWIGAIFQNYVKQVTTFFL